MQGIRTHVSFANVISMIALCLALTGGAYAAGKLSGSKLKNDSVTGKQVKEKSLKPVCPVSAPTRAQDVCFGSPRASNDWDVAARACASDGLRMPSIGELLLITNKVTAPYLWTDEVSDGTNNRILVRTNDAGFSRIISDAKAGPYPYRCVTSAH